MGDRPLGDGAVPLASHQRAVRAIDAGAFDAEIVPYGGQANVTIIERA